MKKCILFIQLFLIHSSFTFCQITSCADSVKTTYYYHSDDNSTVYSVTVDTFNLDSGKVTTCIQSGDSPGTMGSLGCNSGYWSKNILSYNLNGGVTEILTRTGSPTGWKDSVRTMNTYDLITGLKLSESHETWDGTTWVQTYLHSWTYNISNLLVEEIDQDIQSGTTYNLNRTTWNYTGTVLNSKTIQTGSGNTWVNSKNFIFSYDINGIRDSVNYQKWDLTNLVWTSIGISPYYFNNMKLADFIILKVVNIGGNLYPDSAYFSIDTLENIINFYQLTPTGPQAMGDFYNQTTEKYIYVNNIYKISLSSNADYFDDHSGIELSWYCTNSTNGYDYDSSAYLIWSLHGSHCVMPNDYYTRYFYNSNHILIKETGYLDANTRYDEYTYNYFFGNSDSLIAYADPFYNHSGNSCQRDTLLPVIRALGGCGMYHYNWTPTVGLSNDTIPDPIIVVGDSTIYNITVADDNGHVATTQYYSYPRIEAGISIDTASCVGCPVSISTEYFPYYRYQWYYNDSLLANEDSSVIFPLATGYYYVIASDQFFGCPFTSDSVYYLVTKISENFSEEIINLQPNPTNGISQLKIGMLKSQHVSVQLYNISGENRATLFEGNGKDISVSIDSQKYSPGVYIISVTTEKSRRQLRWVVTK